MLPSNCIPVTVGVNSTHCRLFECKTKTTYLDKLVTLRFKSLLQNDFTGPQVLRSDVPCFRQRSVVI